MRVPIADYVCQRARLGVVAPDMQNAVEEKYLRVGVVVYLQAELQLAAAAAYRRRRSHDGAVCREQFQIRAFGEVESQRRRIDLLNRHRRRRRLRIAVALNVGNDERYRHRISGKARELVAFVARITQQAVLITVNCQQALRRKQIRMRRVGIKIRAVAARALH